MIDLGQECAQVVFGDQVLFPRVSAVCLAVEGQKLANRFLGQVGKTQVGTDLASDYSCIGVCVPVLVKHVS